MTALGLLIRPYYPQEYVNGQLKNKYGDAFIRGNNGTSTCPGPKQHCKSEQAKGKFYCVATNS